MDLLDTQLYSLLGDDGFTRLVAAFYRRIPADDLLGPMYDGRDHAAAEWRLREFLIGRFGGPERYLERRGHPRLRMRHAPYPVTPAARDRWMELMGQAMVEAKIPPAAMPILRKFFEDAATFLVNRPAGSSLSNE